jgi:hypothetical protein
LACVVLEAWAATASAGRLPMQYHFENSDTADTEMASWRIVEDADEDD